MKQLNNLILVLTITVTSLNVNAQPVAKNIIVEHFTNSYCSICASRNPGFYGNLSNFPAVLHIAYHPSAPYAACPINQHNKTDNDARANYYGVYGSTPRLVIQGTPISASADYTDASLFQAQQGQMSSFEVTTTMQALNEHGGYVNVTIKKVDTSSLTMAYLYGAILEDTLFFNANNGETKHYDVFRKALWGADVNLPAAVGDSVEYMSNFTLNSAWSVNSVYSIGILQGADKKVIQTGKSNHYASTTNISQVSGNEILSIFPNPSAERLSIKGLRINKIVTIADLSGRILLKQDVSQTLPKVNISTLPAGIYILKIADEETTQTFKFLKQ